jgi:NAD(P)-dependent dehydrogenase (short-subunit alcohol dehydrogenase family)
MNLQNKVILIVGGATGIGRATALLCKERGASIIVADVNEAEGSKTASEVGGLFVKVNVADENSVKAMYAQIAKQHDHLNVLLHTAGILKGAYVSIDDFDVETFRQVFEINVTGSFLCSKHAVPLMRKAGGGVVVLVSSLAATSGSSSYAYGTSKGGVTSLAITMANKLAEENIRVNVLAPGNIDTNMKRSVIAADAERSGKPMEQMVADSKLGTPEGMAKVLAWMASDDADYLRGTVSTR